ncbi:MAG: hypothetical protein A2133_11065 [Actinobacteria bacterium RBG_16_64_13]|nr:MAG: hypothetical protein A2133_11065 [Actinobacteria bacterium RBG_16_64_13]
MPVHPGDPRVAFTRVRTHERDGYEVAQLCLGTHSGTHVDAPRHFFPEGATLDLYPLDRLAGPAVVIDCRPAPGAAPIVEAAFLRERLYTYPVAAGGIVLLWTEGATLTAEAAQLLVESGVGLVGTDAPGVDVEPYPAHRLLLGHGILLAENLCGLDRLGPGPVNCALLPLAAVGTDGAPLRAIAWR